MVPFVMPEKALKTKPLRVTEEVHAIVKARAAALGESMQEVTERACRRECAVETVEQNWTPQYVQVS